MFGLVSFGILCKTAHSKYSPCVEVSGHFRAHVANPPTCGPLLIFSAALKHCGHPGWQGLCSQSAHSWATVHPPSEVLGTPDGMGLVANPPTCEPLRPPPTPLGTMEWCPC